jgi:hypothetical protein
MKVSVKQLDVNTELKNRGMEISVYDAKIHIGDLFINRANIIWCRGKSTPKSGGISMSWNEFINVPIWLTPLNFNNIIAPILLYNS